MNSSIGINYLIIQSNVVFNPKDKTLVKINLRKKYEHQLGQEFYVYI